MKALAVFSGGLDSILAAELIRAQGIDVLALFFETPFFSAEKAEQSAENLGLPFKKKDITSRHLEIVKEPKHGYGGNMNPCIDCHGLMFRIAGEMLAQENAAFVFSGEVMGQRPMSQNRRSLALVARESGIEGLLLRPLSARLLPQTVPEQKGWVDRELLLDIQGRSRKPQMQLAASLNITDYPSPGGGCLLTEQVFSTRLRDLLHRSATPDKRALELLKLGRHFSLNHLAKLVVGRNKRENDVISTMSGDEDLLLRPASVPGPTALLSGTASDEVLELAAAITAAYSDTEGRQKIDVKLTGGKTEKVLPAKNRAKEEFVSLMIN